MWRDGQKCQLGKLLYSMELCSGVKVLTPASPTKAQRVTKLLLPTSSWSCTLPFAICGKKSPLYFIGTCTNTHLARCEVAEVNNNI